MDKNPDAYSKELRESFYKEYNRKKEIIKVINEEKAIFEKEVKEELKKEEEERLKKEEN